MAIRAYYHRRAVKYGGKAEFKEKRFMRAVLAIPAVYFMVRYMVDPGFLAWAGFNIPTWFQWLGLVLGILSIPLTVWVHINLGINFSSVLHIREKHTLITSGPYAWIRHPMYTVLFIHFLGILLMTKNWLMGGVPILALVLIVAVRLRNEEGLMLDTFGDEYRRYMHRTGRFLPKF